MQVVSTVLFRCVMWLKHDVLQKMGYIHYIICHFFSKVFFHEENLADLLTWTLHNSEHQRIVAALQFYSL